MKTNQPTLAELAKASGISTKTLARYKAKGVNIFDAAALRAHAGGNKHAPASLESPDLRAAKLRKINLECERIALALDVERKKLLPIDEVRADIICIAASQRAEDMALVALAGTWEGLTAADMHERALEWFDSKCRNLQHEFAKINEITRVD